MTFLEKLKKEHPDWDDYRVVATARNTCPWNFGYEPSESADAKSMCLREYTTNKCIDCWSREIPETDTEAEPTNDIDIYQKCLFQGHELDRAHLAEELGDVAWYLAVAAKGLGYDLSDIFNMNIAKLRKRYPDGFDADKSVNREV